MEHIISIILPTYNRLYSLKQIFLPSLEKQKYLDYELIVVDDGSNDGTQEFFNSQDFNIEFKNISERFHYIKNEKNMGAPESRNIGVKKAKGDWVWIVEDDIEIEDKNFLEKFIELKSDIDKNIVVISPKREEKNNNGYYVNPKNNFCVLGKLSGEIYLDPTQEYDDFVDNTHCSSFIEKKAYLEVGGQDGVTYFGNTFRDESDLYIRIRQKGGKILYAGKTLKIIHRNDFAINGGQKKVNKKSIFIQEWMVIKNHFLFLQKNYNLSYLRILAFICVRFLKHLTTFTGIKFFKNLAVKFKI